VSNNKRSILISKANIISSTIKSSKFERGVSHGLQIHVRLIGIAILMSILIAACGSQTAEPVEAETQDEVVLFTEFPTEEFGQNRFSPNETFTFLSDGTYFNTRDGVIVVNGTYEIDGNHLTVQDDAANCNVDGIHDVGQYTWEYDGEKLEFSLIKDDCLGRRYHLINGTWVLQP
jgi:hypothetical protein